ncbi:MAG TPA: glycosyltransferase [Anaerolineales bacterium]|nr:glycosyltransferase [Anaerolineales bacterium]
MAMDLSIVIPTRNEEDCVCPLLDRFSPILESMRAEIIFVDDSDDRTPSVLREAAHARGLNVRIIHRTPETRRDGLGGAVLAGIRAAQAPWVCVMDGDLQHPPELIPKLLQAAQSGGLDLIAAGRDLSGRAPIGFSPWRAAISRGLNRCLKFLFRRRLGEITDPLSGMFLFKRNRIDPDRLAPKGYKIMLDILIRHPDLRVGNLTFEFQPRFSGASKADLREGFRFLQLVANLLSIGLIAMVRSLFSDRWIWGKLAKARDRETYFYNIHGIVRIASSVLLPELAHFRAGAPLSEIDLNVNTCPKRTLAPDPDSVNYDEGLGDHGFWLQVRIGDLTSVHASPLLAHSPHVLYTNVVEPILRWILVRKGYALVHGACLSYQGHGLLISAATDTGKTTTILKSLAAYPFDFLSDDMVILGRDGRLLGYPKPLTISLHTLRAAPTAELGRAERVRLQIQSRIHSRLGRRIGILFGNIRLPAATLNAYLQMLVPPPKFPIERLIPTVKRVDSAKLAYVAVIERGPAEEEVIPKEQVYPILARNIEDAYGFPPYPQLAGALCLWEGRDLRADERELIRRAVENLPAVKLLSQDFDWWRRLPAVYRGELFGVPNPISSRYVTVPRAAFVKPSG